MPTEHNERAAQGDREEVEYHERRVDRAGLKRQKKIEDEERTVRDWSYGARERVAI